MTEDRNTVPLLNNHFLLTSPTKPKEGLRKEFLITTIDDEIAVSMITEAMINGDTQFFIDNEEYMKMADSVIRTLCGEKCNVITWRENQGKMDGRGLLDQYSSIYERYNSQGAAYSIPITSTVSDIYAGMTDNRIYGTIPHKPGYWKEGRLEMETTAHLFSLMITGNSEALEMWDVFLPKTKDSFTSMFSQISLN